MKRSVGQNQCQHKPSLKAPTVLSGIALAWFAHRVIRYKPLLTSVLDGDIILAQTIV